MENICEDFMNTIGNTPLMRMTDKKSGASVLAKLEFLNPTGSGKDRVAKAIIENAEKDGKLKKGGTIIESTSGSIGLSLAATAAAKGYQLIITMPEGVNPCRVNAIKAYGARVILTKLSEGMKGAAEKAKQLSAEIPDSFMPNQFENPSNPEVHKLSTAPEIWKDTGGKADVFIAGVGTGGTLTGVGEYLKEKNPKIKIIAVEPESSPLLSEGKTGHNIIQGMGAGFVPKVLNTHIYDRVITVSNKDAFSTAKWAASQCGMLIGASSGAALHAAFKVARHPKNRNKSIVVILPDSGDRLFSYENIIK
jgi:cysteine synthase A